MDERGDSREQAESESKPDDETKEEPKVENGPTEEDATAASGQHKPNPSIPFSMAAYAAVVPVFTAAYQGVKTLYSGSTNAPRAAPSTSNQVNQGEVDQPSTSPTAAVSSSGFTNVSSHIGSFTGFTFSANPPVTNSLVNQLNQPPTSTMATPSSTGSANDLSHTGSPGIASAAASRSVTSSQGNQSEVDKAPTSPEESASSSGFANFRSQVRAFSYSAIQKATEKISFHTFGSLKTVSANKPQKGDDNRKPKKEKRKKKKQGPAKPAKHVKGDS
ncbi:hypothetical protein MTO96_035532 [Rhipicephalus appendiculatus]